MRIVEITRFGGPEVLQVRTVPDPQPAAGQLLIAVDLVEVLFLDTQLRAGWGQDLFPMRPPWVPGTGVAGTVSAVGDGVATDRIGTAVIARTGDHGGYAESVVVDADEAVDIPAGLDPALATAALHDGVLALDRLDRANLTDGSRVLITAAAGSLGQWFVPKAKGIRAFVVGAAGGPVKTAVVTDLGADVAVDYRRPDWPSAAGDDFDVVFDGVDGEIGRTALSLTVDGGQFFGHGAASGDFAAVSGERDIAVVSVDVRLDDDAWRHYTRRALELLADGTVRPVIGQQIPLAQAASAHQAIADRRVIGKSLLITERR